MDAECRRRTQVLIEASLRRCESDQVQRVSLSRPSHGTPAGAYWTMDALAAACRGGLCAGRRCVAEV